MMKKVVLLLSLCLVASVAWAARTTVEIKADIRLATAALETARATNGDVTEAKTVLVALHKELSALSPRRVAALDDGGEICESATDVDGIPYTDYGVISEETEDDYDYADVCGLDGADLVYRITIGPNGLPVGTYTITTCGSDFDTVIELWEGCPGTDNATLVNCNDDLYEDAVCFDGNSGLSSCISGPELDEGTYYLVIFGFNYDTGDYRLNVNNVGDCGNGATACTGEAENAYCYGALPVVWEGHMATYQGDSRHGAFDESLEYCGTEPEACGLWYEIVGTGSLMTAITCSELTYYDTKINVYTGSCDNLVCVAGNDDNPECYNVPGGGGATVEWCTVEGESYYVFVNGKAGQAGEFEVHFFQEFEPCCGDYYFSVEQVPFCQCLTICPGQIQKIFVGPAGPNDRPVASWSVGCGQDRTIPPSYCEEECPPAYPQLYMDWIYLPDQMLWCMDLYSADGGCYCFCIDRILPVELSSFAAIAGDRQVTINWSTASETDADRFELTRDGLTVASLEARNSATGAAYSWTEQGLTNGTSYSYTLSLVNLDGSREVLATESVTPNASSVANEFALDQNYPNPFNPVTNISFNLVESGPVSLKVYNLAGQELATLAEGTYNAGRYNVSFDGSGLASGVYLYRLVANGKTAQHKMVLLK